MKKLIILAASCLSLGALVACGNKGESKSAWTEEDTALFSECLVTPDIPFMSFASKASLDEDYSTLLFEGGKGSQKAIDNAASFFEKNGCYEFVRGQYASHFSTQDLAACHDFSDEYDVVEYFRFGEKDIPSKYVQYGPFGFFDLFAIGVDAESGNLVVVAAPMVAKFSYINFDYDGMSFYYAYDEGTEQYSDVWGHVNSSFEDLYATSETTTAFDSSVFVFPALSDGDLFGLTDTSWMFPWLRGNMLSDDFEWDLGLELVTGETTRDNLITELENAGFTAGSYNPNTKSTPYFKVANESLGLYYFVGVGDYDEQFAQFSADEYAAGFEVVYTAFFGE